MVAVVLVAGCAPAAAPSPSPAAPAASPAATRPASSPAAGTRAEDLAALVEALEENHPEPFLDEGRAAFEGRVNGLAATVDDGPDDVFLVEVMRLLAGRDRDGHTGLIPFAQAEAGQVGLTAWPIAIYEFDEGFYVVDAQAPHEDTIGSRVVAVAGRPVAEVAAAVAQLVPGDNEWTVKARSPAWLVVPAVLRGLNILEPGTPALSLERPDGTTVDLTPTEVPVDDFRRWRGLFDPLVPPTLPADDGGPLTLRNRDEHFWLEVVAGVLYVGYHQVQSETAGGMSMTGLAGRVRDAFDDGTADRVVVDVRHNPGGENGSYPPLLEVLRERAADRPGSVVVLIGRSTFSAAGNFITELRATPGVRFVGEPSGAAPNLYGDATIVRLPVSGYAIHVATRWWEFAPGEDALWIEPDERVPVRWADYAVGADPALEVALTLD